eukprot:5881532-Lingulodinium_polyedra.AAC.1
MFPVHGRPPPWHRPGGPASPFGVPAAQGAARLGVPVPFGRSLSGGCAGRQPVPAVRLPGAGPAGWHHPS